MPHANVFSEAPARVYWEITRACDLACRHCRAEAAPGAGPRQLDHETALRLLGQLAAAEPKPHLVLTGGDPLKRADLFELIATARSLGLAVSVSPSATPLLTPEAIAALKTSGVDAISLSLDGATAASHDAIRQVEGCFARTLASAEAARAAELPFQVNTLVSAETIDEMPQIERLARSLGASRWSLFFLVTVGRGTVLQPITAERTEQLLEWLAERGREPGMIVTTTEAPHFRRIAMARRPEGMPKRPAPAGNGHMAGIRDGNGIMFIGDDGEVFPSGFLPISAGNVNTTDPIKIYRESELFLALRDVSKFGGRCGQCEFGSVCGGSRARAWAATGDWLAEDPLCPYEPRGYTPEAQPAKPMHLPVV